MILLLRLGLVVLGTIFGGYALTVLWFWFVIPAFALPPLTIPTAIGLSIIASYLTHQANWDEEASDSSEAVARQAAIALFKPSFALAVGWVVTKFM